MTTSSANILGVEVTSGDPSAIRDVIDDRIACREPTGVAFLNANLSNISARDARLGSILNTFLVLNDGVGVDVARKVLHGEAFRHNLNGTDFTPYFLETSRHDLRLFLLGAKQEIAEKVAEAIGSKWPRHRVVGVQSGYFNPADEAEIAARIREAEPDLVLVAMGNPRQEDWIFRNVPDVCTCAFAVGAWFDFMSGTVPRAPSVVRRMRAEWLYRLSREPMRLGRRYLIGNLVFLSRLGRAYIQNRG